MERDNTVLPSVNPQAGFFTKNYVPLYIEHQRARVGHNQYLVRFAKKGDGMPEARSRWVYAHHLIGSKNLIAQYEKRRDDHATEKSDFDKYGLSTSSSSGSASEQATKLAGIPTRRIVKTPERFGEQNYDKPPRPRRKRAQPKRSKPAPAKEVFVAALKSAATPLDFARLGIGKSGAYQTPPKPPPKPPAMLVPPKAPSKPIISQSGKALQQRQPQHEKSLGIAGITKRKHRVNKSIHFNDHNSVKCRLEDAVHSGLVYMGSDAATMCLDRHCVGQLLPYLTSFVETGRLE